VWVGAGGGDSTDSMEAWDCEGKLGIVKVLLSQGVTKKGA